MAFDRNSQWASDLREKLLRAYWKGEMFAGLGPELEAEVARLFDQVEQAVICAEIGSAAELCRLKDFLGESLPKNWEALRLVQFFTGGDGEGG